MWLYADAIVNTSSYTQNCTAMSSATVKYVAPSDEMKLLIWLGQLLCMMEIPQSATVVYQKDQETIEW